MADAFAWIEQISPWWWVAFAIILGAIEMATLSFFLIGPALAALVTAILIGIFPAMPGPLRIMIFAAIAVALTFLGRSLFKRFGQGKSEDPTLNSRSAALVGRKGKVLAWDGGEGSVEIDGIRWRAEWEGGQVSEVDWSVEVISADSMTLTVKNLH